MKNVWLLVLACICMTACRNRQQSAEVTNYDLPQIKDSGEFVINLAPDNLVKAVDYCGCRTGASLWDSSMSWPISLPVHWT